jgi:hypothetical protein
MTLEWRATGNPSPTVKQDRFRQSSREVVGKIDGRGARRLQIRRRRYEIGSAELTADFHERDVSPIRG